ncbi:hypothetical protein [Lacipirellula limnantheis]|uniref:hypothetical protein n=1 Tax=Lacipirellula limnantheis TaxID=2528024 RepID=UPI00143D2C7B|nr:hypothetical protein [Lacipirellula limnantheis]
MSIPSCATPWEYVGFDQRSRIETGVLSTTGNLIASVKHSGQRATNLPVACCAGAGYR